MRPNDPSEKVKATFDASPEGVFAAWTTPALMERWLFKSPTNTLQAKSDAQPGGRFSVIEIEAGERIDHFGTYEVLQKPRRIACALEVPKHFSGVARLELEIVPVGHRTEMTLTLGGARPADAKQLWSRMFETLGRVLAET